MPNPMHDHLSPSDEISSIHAELRQLDDAARTIANTRIALFRRLNAVQSGTSVLPPETLSLIFQLVIASSDEIPRRSSGQTKDRPPCPIFLGSISHAWRQVAWSTPHLWTALSRIISPKKAEKFASLLDVYLANVHDLPFTLRIVFDYNHKYLLEYENDPIARVLFKAENSTKVSTLQLRYPPTSWLSRFDGPFLRLAEVHLEDGDRSALITNTSFLTNAPRLRNISLRFMDPPPAAPWSHITTLKLEYVSATLALRCLVESPGLVEFYCRDLIIPEAHSEEEQGEPPEMPNPLTLHHLKTLCWPFKLNRASDLFLHQIRLPALRTLTWDQRERPSTGTFSSGMWRFFGNLSFAPLTTLCIWRMFNADIALIKHIYHENPRVEHLQLEYCNEETLRVALGSLIPGWNVERPAYGRQYLTQLKTLDIKCCESDKNSISVDVLGRSFGDIVADLLIGRASKESTTNLTINFIRTGIEWMPKTKELLREFNRTGAQVRLLLDGEQVDWL